MNAEAVNLLAHGLTMFLLAALICLHLAHDERTDAQLDALVRCSAFVPEPP